MEENRIREDQVEPIIRDFATYCLRHEISYDTIIKSGREALYLEHKFEVPIEKIPEYITQGKKTLDNLEDQRQEIIGQVQLARIDRDAKRRERDTLTAEIEKFKAEIPSIQRIKELENELIEVKRMNEQLEISVRVLTKERDSAMREAARSEVDAIELEASQKEIARRLSICQKELDKLNQKVDG
jgi:chromosome segregation ATPase